MICSFWEAQVGLPDLARRARTALSGNRQQRVAVARGLAGQPDALLMEEPFSNLDAKPRDQVRAELKALQRRLGISTLFVTHDRSEALALSDRIAVMPAGRIAQIGAPLDLDTRPKTAFLRDFIGQTIRMAGRVVELGEGRPLRVRPGNGQGLGTEGENLLSQAAVDMPCLVTVRPEEIPVPPRERADALAPSEGHVEARIRTLLFLGRGYEAFIEMPRGHAATLFLPRNVGCSEGQEVLLTIPPEAIQVWPREPEGAE